MKTFTEVLQGLNACPEAIKWVNGRSLRKSWQVANRADWMLWLARKIKIDRKLLVLAACDCAETALKFVPAGEDRPAIAIRTARDWCNGKATIKQVRVAADAADAAADAADAAAAYADAADAYAADAAAYAAAAAYDYAADDAAYDAAAYAAAYAAYDAAAYADAAHKNMCKLIRKRIPVTVIESKIGDL